MKAGASAREVVERLRRASVLGAKRARLLRRPVLAWASAPLPSVDVVEAFARSAAPDRVFWARTEERFALAGLGSAWTVTPQGPGRFDQAAAAWRACVDDAVVGETDGETHAGPLAFGGFAFSPDGPVTAAWSGFPAAAIVVPRLTVCAAGDARWVALAVTVEPDGPVDIDDAAAHLRAIIAAAERGGGDDAADGSTTTPVLDEVPSAGRWKAAVGRATQAARDGLLRKVVLARGINVRGLHARPATALRELMAGYPSCAIFGVARGDRCFLGATPERLVRIRAGQVSTMAVAGSAPRGRTQNEDRRLGEALLKSPKDRLEHAVVVDVVREVMAETCADLTPAGAPALLKVANIQHLLTPLAGQLRERLSVLDLAGRLHPTPAVGGFPRDRALRWMHEHEELERGWYAGPVGWVDRHGEGEFAVAIRSALMHGHEALLYAGCGIVADSDPDQEYAESWLKLRPMLSALGVDHAAGWPAGASPLVRGES